MRWLRSCQRVLRAGNGRGRRHAGPRRALTRAAHTGTTRGGGTNRFTSRGHTRARASVNAPGKHGSGIRTGVLDPHRPQSGPPPDLPDHDPTENHQMRRILPIATGLALALPRDRWSCHRQPAATPSSRSPARLPRPDRRRVKVTPVGPHAARERRHPVPDHGASSKAITHTGGLKLARASARSPSELPHRPQKGAPDSIIASAGKAKVKAFDLDPARPRPPPTASTRTSARSALSSLGRRCRDPHGARVRLPKGYVLGSATVKLQAAATRVTLDTGTPLPSSS